MPAPSEPAPAELPGWDVSIAPGGPDGRWWCALTSSSTDKRTSRLRRPPGSSTDSLTVTSTRYTLRSLALPRVPDWGEGRAAALPGHRCEITLTWQTADGGVPERPMPEPGGAAGMGSPQSPSLSLDGERVPAMVQRGRQPVTPGKPTWRAVGSLVLPAGPSAAQPVSFEVTGFGVAELPREWASVPVAILLRHRDVWLAP